MLSKTVFQGKEFFQKARRIFFWKPTMVDNSVHNTIQNTIQIVDNKSIDLLARHVIPGVEHDSSEREPPRCHPGTRVDICRNINQSWFHNLKRQHKILWLRGLAGVGKSAIMQTLAEAESILPNSVLGAAIFFSRRNRRNDPRRLFISIAYQLAVKYPGYRAYINEILGNDPRIAEKSMGEQFKWFIARPFVERDVLHGRCQTVLVMIDGLDECRGEEAQRDLIMLIGQFTLAHPQTPIIWAIASRPEPHILAAFALPYIKASYWEVEVPADSSQACADIERFLNDKFQEIQQRYSSFFPLAIIKWPPEGDFLKISNAAAGLFIFAAVVIRFIMDESYGNPLSQLKKVLSVIDKTSSELRPSPLATLDSLYTEILSAVPSDILPTTKSLLALSFGNSSQDTSGIPYVHVPTFWMSCNLLRLSQSDAHGALRKLHSVIRIPSPEGVSSRIFLEVSHASFIDYITSPSRSVKFCIEEPAKIQLAGAIRVLMESHNALECSIELSRVEVSWAYEEKATVQKKLLRWSFETVFSDIREAISCEDDPQRTGDSLAAFFRDLDYGKPESCCDLLSGDLFVYAEPSIFSVLSDWGLARMIPLRNVISLSLDRIRSDESCQVGVSEDSDTAAKGSIPSFFYKRPEALVQGKSPLSDDPKWRRRISIHLGDILALQLRFPPRIYMLGKGEKSAVGIFNNMNSPCKWWYMIPYDQS